MLRHARYRFRNLAARTSKPCTFEQDDLSPCCKWVRNRRVPIVECPSEMLKEQQWKPGAFPKAAIRVFFLFRLKELSWTTYVAGGLYVRHLILLYSRSRTHSSRGNVVSLIPPL